MPMLSLSPLSLAFASTPVFAVRGVFVPGWIFYALGAALLAALIREVVIGLHGGPVPGLGAPFYAALGVVIGLGAYLIRIGGL